MKNGIPCRYCGRSSTHQVGLSVDSTPAGLTSIYVCSVHSRSTVLVAELIASSAFRLFAQDAVERRLVLPDTFEVVATYHALSYG